MSKLFRATVFITGLTFIGQGLNFLINSFLASKLGVGKEMDCYLNATSLPTYIIIIITGSLSATFIPSFVSVKSELKRINLISSILFIGLFVGSIISILLYVYSIQIINIQSPGFRLDLKIYSSILLRKSLILINLTILNEIFSGYFYSINQYLIPVLNKIISPVITIFILIFSNSNIDASLVISASIIGLFLQNLILLILYFKNGKRLNFNKIIPDDEAIKVFRLMIPLLIGSIFYKILPLFDKYFLSTLPIGSTSIVNYSQRLFLTATQVMGAGLSMQVLSHMSNLVSENSISEFKNTLNKIFKIILYVTIPITVFTLNYSSEIVKIVFERGLFNSNNTEKVAINLMIYSIAIPAVAIGTIVSQGLYVLKHTWAPFIVGVFEILVYIIICYSLIKISGILVFPIAYVIYFYFSIIILQFWLNRQINYIKLNEIINISSKCLIISLVEVLLLNLISKTIFQNYPVSILIILPLATILYLITTYYFKLNEALFFISKISVKIKR